MAALRAHQRLTGDSGDELSRKTRRCQFADSRQTTSLAARQGLIGKLRV